MAYIDRDLLLKDIEESVVFSVSKGQNSLEIKGANKVIDRIKQMPTTDVQEVRRGTWLISPDGWYPYCSECGYEPCRPLGDKDNRTKYCPNCGVRMTKEFSYDLY